MRSIKFRGKQQSNGAWIKGNLIQDEGLCWIEGIPVIPGTVGQSIGLKENLGEGQEVFEGDIVRWHGWDGEGNITAIEWDENMCRFVYRYKSGHYRNLSSEYFMTIVGHVLTDAHMLTE